MPIKTLTLGIAMVLACTVFGSTKHTVRSGDTVSALAGRYGVSQKAILQANGLRPTSRLNLGQKLVIPTAARGTRTAATSRNRTGHVVVSGDNDTKIAKRYGVSSSALRAANPGVNWRRLQLGQAIVIPGSRPVASLNWSSTQGNRPAPRAQVVARPTAPKTVAVRRGDNDWIIARRVGTTASEIRKLNPNVRWNRLQIGQTIRVPGSTTGGTMRVASAPTPVRSRYMVVTGNNVAVRRSPATSGRLVTRVDQGTRVTVLDREGQWLKLQFPRGTKGWVRNDYLRATSAPSSTMARRPGQGIVKSSTRVAKLPSTGYDLLDKANSFRGVRYRYGAASRSGTDCSGFTTQVFRSKGVKLPRTSASQARVGAPVSRGSLKAGDLVFFRTGRSRRINHVGIYMGNGKFIHASSGGGRVQTNSLNEGYYQKRFVTARRVAKVTPKKVASTKPAAPAPKKIADPEPAVTTSAPTLDSAPSTTGEN